MPNHAYSVLALALALSGVGLLGGPLILALGRGRAIAGAITEGLTLGLVPTMVVLRLLPHTTEALGAWALVLTAASFFALRWFDGAHHRAAARVGRAFIYTALLLHSFTDGVGLAAAIAAGSDARGMDLTLTLAFLVHRLPEGLFIATTLLPSYGMRRTLLRIAGLGASTVAGGLLGGALLPHLPERLFDGVVALGLGAMLQLVVHSHADRTTRPSTRARSALALLGGVALAVVVPAPRDLLRAAAPGEITIAAALGPLFVRTAPALLVAILAGALGERLPAPRAPTGGGARALLSAIVLGARLPLGPAGAIPAARGLWAQGASLRVTTAFAVSAMTLGLEGLLLSVVLLGGAFAGARYVAAGLVAVVAALLAGGAARPSARLARHAAPHATSPGTPLDALLRALDQRGAWYLFGLLGACALEASVPAGALARSSGPSLLLLGLAASLPFHLPLVCVLPLSAVLVHKGLSPGAALAFALCAPALHAHGLLLVARAGGAALAARIALGVLAGSVALGLLAASPLARVAPPALHALLGAAPGPLALVAAAALGTGLLVSLIRLGPRLWLGQIDVLGEPAHEDGGAHAHAHA